MTRHDEAAPRDGAIEAFAHAFPALAASLARPLRNPFVERVVEGLGVLTNRIQRVLDTTAPRASTHVADVLFPELLRPFPASTILELTPNASRQRETLGSGCEFDAISLDGTRCRFRAHAPLRIDPWRVVDAKLAWSSSRGQSLEVVLAPTGTLRAADSLPPVLPLRLHLAGEARSAFTLLASLHLRLAGIDVNVAGKTVSLGREALHPWGFAAGDALLPPDALEHPGFRLLREFQILPAKFAFVEIAGDVPLPQTGDRIALRLHFDSPLPQGTHVSAESLRTNCVPVTNAFATTTDPLRATLDRPSHVLRPAGLSPAHADVYSVRRVVARLENGRTQELAEASAFEGRGAEGTSGMGYSLRRVQGAPSKGHDLSLELQSAADAGDSPEARVLSVDVWATNRELPDALGIGDVRLPTTLSPAGCTFRNITAVSPFRNAPDGTDLQWRTLALLALTARPIARADSVKTLLHALNLHRTTDKQAARAHAQRLDAVKGITTKASSVTLTSGTARGRDITLELIERAFDGEGEAYLFGRALAHVFAHEASLNAFARTRIRLVDTGREYNLPPLNGDREVC